MKKKIPQLLLIVACVLVLLGSVLAQTFHTSMYTVNVDRISFETEKGVLCDMRSSRFNINPIAVKYGGGGHAKASGATVRNRDEAMAMLADLDALMEDAR